MTVFAQKNAFTNLGFNRFPRITQTPDAQGESFHCRVTMVEVEGPNVFAVTTERAFSAEGLNEPLLLPSPIFYHP